MSIKWSEHILQQQFPSFRALGLVKYRATFSRKVPRRHKCCRNRFIREHIPVSSANALHKSPAGIIDAWLCRRGAAVADDSDACRRRRRTLLSVSIWLSPTAPVASVPTTPFRLRRMGRSWLTASLPTVRSRGRRDVSAEAAGRAARPRSARRLRWFVCLSASRSAGLTSAAQRNVCVVTFCCRSAIAGGGGGEAGGERSRRESSVVR